MDAVNRTPLARHRSNQTAFLVCALLGFHGAPAFAQTASRSVDAVGAIGMTVGDLDRSTTFFTDVLMFEKVAETKLAGDEFARLQHLPSAKARVAKLQLGNEFVELTEYASPKGREFPSDSRSNDLWFQHIAIIVSDMDKAYGRLQEKNVRPASAKGPQTLPAWNKNAAGIKAFYFRDPDGHYMELLEFPSDKGDPRWHRKSDRLFLGIDHTAIVVSDTDASLRFYRDALGFNVVGGSENHGPEQQALNNVPGAHLRITTLRARAGPAIEFLEYLNPRDGRPYPTNAESNDLLHWQTTLLVRDAAGVASKLRAGKARFHADPTLSSEKRSSADNKAFIVRDPDGHALKIIEE
ncbi:MAG: VOC family protein [Planctomycetes bacterium]|nr:VOC family protein [Planctomycetota bacterium]